MLEAVHRRFTRLILNWMVYLLRKLDMSGLIPRLEKVRTNQLEVNIILWPFDEVDVARMFPFAG